MITTEKPKFTKVTLLCDKTKSVYYVHGESLLKLAEVLGENGAAQAPIKAKARRGRKPKAAQAVETTEAA